MIRGFLIALVSWSVLFPSLSADIHFSGVHSVPGRQRAFRVREVNVYAPDVYADHLDFKAILMDLPGARNKRSYWELSCQLYFISEERFDEVIRRLLKGPANLTPEQFPGRILLAESHKKIRHLGTLKERTINLTRVPFKRRVPDTERTKFARLMTHFSVRIFDAELNTTIYKSGIFLTEPYEENPQDQNQAIARKTIYLSFRVTPEGSLNYSQLARHAGVGNL
jgi:hypothetical protein